MAHLDLKVRLQDANHAEEIKRRFENKGATLFFNGTENDKIYYGVDGAFIKHRRAKGIGNENWVYNAESDEIMGIEGKGNLVDVDQAWAIHYKETPSDLPSPHYLIKTTASVLHGIGKNIYTDKNLYAEIAKERSVYWLTEKDTTQGALQSNLRIHIDKVDFGKPEYFLEVEAKFNNAYSSADLSQAQKDLTSLRRELSIRDEDILPNSYGKMRRDQIMGNIRIDNNWIDMVPFELLKEFAASKHKIFQPHQNLMAVNGLNDGAHVILDGRVRVYYLNNQYDFPPGHIMGELATVNNTDRRCATVEAQETTETLHLEKGLVVELCGCPSVVHGWLKRYAPSPAA